MITILLPVYNDANFVEYTIKSIKAQTFKDFKCLVGFNGTTDSSIDIVGREISKDKRFEIFDYGSDRGKSKTLNKLLLLSDREYISLIDGDDIWDENKLEEQIKIIGKFDIIGTLSHYIDEKNLIIHTLNLDENNSDIKSGFENGHNQIVNSSAIFRRSDALDISGWDPETEGLEDFDFWLKLHKKDRTFYNIQKPLVYHRIHKNSNFNSKKLRFSITDILQRNNIIN